MEWQVIVALIIAIPVVLFPVALVWYLNIGGIYIGHQGSQGQAGRPREREEGHRGDRY